MKIHFLIVITVLVACTSPKKETDHDVQPGITSEVYGVLPDSTEVTQYTLTNIHGMQMKVITYGGIITSLSVPDRNGELEDVVLGYDKLEQYVKANPYFGALIGRYGNRIAHGKFSLDGNSYILATNNGPNHLHGGIKGFDKVVWKAEEIMMNDSVGLKLTHTSKDMDEGFPGNLSVTVTYLLDSDNKLTIDYQATTDKKTIVNLTQHSYFNLNAMKLDVLDHELMINASSFLPVDSTLIPTGEWRSVEGTPFDFTSPKKIGKDINAPNNEQIKFGAGYDHCWVLKESEDTMKLAATLYDSASGRFMEVHTTEPGLQFYTGNFLDGAKGKNNISYHQRYGLCLETQHYPDSPNQPGFPSVVLNPGEEYHTITSYKFSAK